LRRPHIKSANPFYGLLVIAGIAFALTAISYGVMAFREARPPGVDDAALAQAEHPLHVWMSRHGETALLTELGLLAICTIAAIGTDNYWQRRANRQG
jgi:hypothetical protein